MIATRCNHALQWLVMGPPDSFPDEVKLSCGNHVFDIRNVVDDVLNCGVLYILLFHTCHVDG
jgi:hypothetical protein